MLQQGLLWKPRRGVRFQILGPGVQNWKNVFCDVSVKFCMVFMFSHGQKSENSDKNRPLETDSGGMGAAFNCDQSFELE